MYALDNNRYLEYEPIMYTDEAITFLPVIKENIMSDVLA